MADAAQPGAAAPKSNKTMITCLIVGLVGGCGGIFVIGVVAAIAVPNFMKFECKSKQSEAKSELRSLYVAEKSFQAEWGFYTSDLVALNWSPSTRTPRYVYGFYYHGPEDVSGGPSDHDIERASTDDEDVVAKGGYSTSLMVTSDGEDLTYDFLPEDSFVERGEFVAAAVGDIRADDVSGLDVHLIDQDGKLEVLEDDCGG